MLHILSILYVFHDNIHIALLFTSNACQIQKHLVLVDVSLLLLDQEPRLPLYKHVRLCLLHYNIPAC